MAGAFGGVAVAVLATGCDPGEDLTQPGTAPSGSSGTPSAQVPEQTTDEALVDEVLGELSAALGLLVGSRKDPTLRQALAPIVRAHRQHIEALEGDLPAASPSGAALDAADALRAVRRSERLLQASLADAAGRAESGALAMLLASMSASGTQHLALIPPEAAP